MKTKLLLVSLLLGLFPLSQAQVKSVSKPCITCEQLKQIKIPDVKIIFAKDSTAGYCRVLGIISKEINFELLLPKEWNNRFLMGGGGGFVGSIDNQFRFSVDSGFATAGTDTGHKGQIQNADWALNNMERELNFGKLAVHRTSVVSKAIIAAYYGKDPVYSYFMGGSRGGGQALIEAQFYPEDFNGIVSFTPAFAWPAMGAKMVYDLQKTYPGPDKLLKPVITLDNLKLLDQIVLKQFDGLDGVNDSIINNPQFLRLNISSLPVCPDNRRSADCFTKQQIEAIRTIYSPLVIQKDTIYPGFPVGGENENNGWRAWITGSDTLRGIQCFHYYFGTGIFKYFVFNDPEWDYSKYTFTDFFRETRYASSFLDATNTDYSEFEKRGGKLIIVHGWSDPALSAFATINHYKAIERKEKDIRSHIRLFLLPGVLHYDGGTGPDHADWIHNITSWVEEDKAPERVIVNKIRNNKVVMTRPVYPYPKTIKYVGSGNSNLESNFILDNGK